MKNLIGDPISNGIDLMIIAWLSPHRFPAWREVYRRTAAAADVLIVRVQRGNPLRLVASDLGNEFDGRPVHVIDSDRWNSSNWRQEFCDRARDLIGSEPATILQFDEDEALSRESIATDLKRIEAGDRSVWYRFQGPLPSADGAFDHFPANVTYPAAPHCKIWRWFPEASFTVPRYQGYAAPCGIPKQPDRTLHVLSPNRIMHLLLATPELRVGRRELLTKYLRRGRCLNQLDAALADSPQPQDFTTWLTSIVGK